LKPNCDLLPSVGDLHRYGIEGGFTMIIYNGTLLTARRGDTDQTWRDERLRRTLQTVNRGIGSHKEYARWAGAIVSLHDHKGELTVGWRSFFDMGWFERRLRLAWRGQEEFVKIRHRPNMRARKPKPTKAMRSLRR
jgi:hypothetical protein